MKAIIWVLGVLLLICFGKFALIWSGAYNIAADEPHWRLTERVMETLRDRSVAVRASSIVAPNLTDESLIRAGAGNYDAMCTGCHLQPGIEQSEVSVGLYPSPPNLTRRRMDDAARAFWVIKHGIKLSGMPAWGRSMEDEHIWGMVAFLRELHDMAPKRYRELVETSGGHSHGKLEEEPHSHDVPENARTAAATVDRFFSALAAGDLKRAGTELDPEVIILESGGGEYSAVEYLEGHAKHDAAFLKAAHHQPGRRAARVSGDLAWVASESELHVQKDGKPTAILSAETMVLRSSAAGWKIVHIHWSSRAGKS